MKDPYFTRVGIHVNTKISNAKIVVNVSFYWTFTNI